MKTINKILRSTAFILLLSTYLFAGPNDDLITACRAGDFQAASKAISAGADANALDKDGKSAISNAFFWPKITQLLIDNGADVNGGNYPAIINASNNYSLEVLDILLDNGGDPNLPGMIRDERMKPIYDQIEMLETQAASAKGKSKKIYEDGIAALKAQYGDALTGGIKVYALNLTVQATNCVECIDKLMANGAKTDLASGQPLIHIYAAYGNSRQARKELFAQGVDNMKKFGFKTPDWYGALPDDVNASTELVLKRILSAGIAIDQLNSQGQTALHTALAGGVGNKKEVMLALLNNGADFKIEDPKFGKCFTLAAKTGVVEVVEAMLAKGADMGETSKILDLTIGQSLKGATPIIAATMHNHLEMVKFLVSKGASIKEDAEGFSYNMYTGCATGVKNKSAIYFAIDNQNMEMIKYMVEESGLNWYRPLKVNQLKKTSYTDMGSYTQKTTKCYSDGSYIPSAYAKKIGLGDISKYLKGNKL